MNMSVLLGDYICFVFIIWGYDESKHNDIILQNMNDQHWSIISPHVHEP